MGDKKNAIKKLQQSIRAIKYPQLFEIKEMDIGSPREYLKLFHYLFMDYSPLIANEILVKHNLELNSKNDKAFIDGIYRVLRDMFAYVPKLNRDQFFTVGFAQVKAIMACEVIGLMQGKLKSLQPASTSFLANNSNSSSSSQQKISISKSLSNNSIDSKVQNHRLAPPKNLKIDNIPSSINTHILDDPVKPLTTMNEISIVAKALENFNSKFETLTERLIPLESRINTTMAAVTGDCTNSEVEEHRFLNDSTDSMKINPSDFNSLLMRVCALERENENLKDRIIILETQNLTNRANLLPGKTRESMNQTADATMFHSFIDNSRLSGSDEENYPEIKAKNGSHAFVNLKNKCGIFQGSPVDFDKLNDYSIESTELTPTVDTVSKTSKFINNDSNIMRAKELVSRASELSKGLNSNMKSM